MSDTNRIIINDIKINTSAYRIPRWRTNLTGGHIVSINNIQIQDTSHFASIVSSLWKNKAKHTIISICPYEKINKHADSTVLQITFNQMSIMAHQHNAAINSSLEWTDLHNSSPFLLDYICNATSDVPLKKLTRTKLMQ